MTDARPPVTQLAIVSNWDGEEVEEVDEVLMRRGGGE